VSSRAVALKWRRALTTINARCSGEPVQVGTPIDAGRRSRARVRMARTDVGREHASDVVRRVEERDGQPGASLDWRLIRFL